MRWGREVRGSRVPWQRSVLVLPALSWKSVKDSLKRVASADDQAAWHLRYCPQKGLEMRAWATPARVEGELRAAGAEVTIHALWVELADRVGKDGEPEVTAPMFNKIAQALQGGAAAR